MSLSSETMTPADIAAVTNNGGMFGGDASWWIIILFLFLFSGGKGNLFGSSGATDGYILTSDFANIERKIDGVNNGLCSGFYQEAQLVNGVNQNMNTGFAQAELSRANNQSALQQQLFNMQMAQQQCCCENRSAIEGVNYNIAAQTTALGNTICNSTREILDALTAQRIEQKDAKIAEQAAQISALNLAASQSAQNAYLIQTLKPAPVPSFPASQLYGYMGCNCTG